MGRWARQWPLWPAGWAPGLEFGAYPREARQGRVGAGTLLSSSSIGGLNLRFGLWMGAAPLQKPLCSTTDSGAHLRRGSGGPMEFTVSPALKCESPFPHLYNGHLDH